MAIIYMTLKNKYGWLERITISGMDLEDPEDIEYLNRKINLLFDQEKATEMKISTKISRSKKRR